MTKGTLLKTNKIYIKPILSIINVHNVSENRLVFILFNSDEQTYYFDLISALCVTTTPIYL